MKQKGIVLGAVLGSCATIGSLFLSWGIAGGSLLFSFVVWIISLALIIIGRNRPRVRIAGFVVMLMNILLCIFFISQIIFVSYQGRLTDVEKTLCGSRLQSEMIKVSRCNLPGGAVLYDQMKNSRTTTDSGQDFFFNHQGEHICTYGWFLGNSCDAAIQTVYPGFNWSQCSWKVVCQNAQ